MTKLAAPVRDRSRRDARVSPSRAVAAANASCSAAASKPPPRSYAFLFGEVFES